MMPSIDRNDLLEEVAQRDEAALRSLYRSYGGVIRALAVHTDSWERRIGSGSSGEVGGNSGGRTGSDSGGGDPSRESRGADEAVEDVFVAVWEAAPRFDRSKADPDTWLLTLGHRLLVQRERDRRHDAGLDAAGSDADKGELQRTASESMILPSIRSGSRVHTRVAGLDDDSRYLLAAAFFGGLSVAELAGSDSRSRSPREIARVLVGVVDRLRGSVIGPAAGLDEPPSEGRSFVATEPMPAPMSAVETPEGMIDDAMLVDYAFGTVARNRTAEIEAYLDEHPAVGNRVREIQDALAGLVMSLDHPTPATGGDVAEDDLVARLRAGRRPPLPARAPGRSAGRRSQALIGLGMAAALGLTVWLALGPLSGAGRLDRRIARYQEQPGALSTQLQDRDGDELGTLVRLENGRLFVAFEERPAGAMTYQLWELRGERIRSLGITEDRTVLTPAVAAGALVAITLEPSGGSAEPSGEVLVELRL